MIKMANINKKELAVMVQELLTIQPHEKDGKAVEGRKITKKFAGEAVDAVITAIENALVNGDNVKLTSFGNFELRERSGRTGRNPQTGEALEIAGRTAPAFKPAKALKEAVKDVVPNEVASDDSDE